MQKNVPLVKQNVMKLEFFILGRQIIDQKKEGMGERGSIGKNDSNREMNLRAKPNVMNQAINHRACDKIKGQITS